VVVMWDYFFIFSIEFMFLNLMWFSF